MHCNTGQSAPKIPIIIVICVVSTAFSSALLAIKPTAIRLVVVTLAFVAALAFARPIAAVVLAAFQEITVLAILLPTFALALLTFVTFVALLALDLTFLHRRGATMRAILRPKLKAHTLTRPSCAHVSRYFIQLHLHLRSDIAGTRIRVPAEFRLGRPAMKQMLYQYIQDR